MTRTLNVLQAPDTSNTVTDACGKKWLVRVQDGRAKENALRTRPVSSTSAPMAVPEIRDSKMLETSDAAESFHDVEDGAFGQ